MIGSARELGLLNFISRLPVWALGLIAVVVLGAVGTLGYFIYKPAHVDVATAAQGCTNTNTTKLATLFSDSQNTMIRLSNPDYTDMHVLRTEPANVLPGMFDALLSLSGDGSRLAYVTATDEILDNAHIDYIDVANPSNRVDLTDVSNGLWVVRPAWSPDHKKLAFVKLNLTGGPPGQYELWVADATTQPATAAVQSDLVADNFTNGHSASICWTADNRVVLVPNTPTQFATPSPTPKAAVTPSPSASPSTGSPCGVPIFSQQDPAWRTAVMKAGADTIGGYGCALTSTAMLLNYYGSNLTPPQLNTCLGGGADPIAWTAVPTCTSGQVTGGDRIDFTWTDLDALLASGRPAIVGMLRGLTGSHFVVVTSGGGGLASNYHITDPWDATTYKTLGNYINDGYTPRWIISYSGPGHNCGRLIKGVVPAINGIQDGGVTKNPVTINILPNINNIKELGIIQLSSSAIIPDTFNLPLPFTPITTGKTITDEGIYQILLVTQAPSQPPVVQLYEFTIDHTPPVVDLSLLNPVSAGDAVSYATESSSSSGSSDTTIPTVTSPVIGKPGMVRIQSSDTLSGVDHTTFSLDGSAFAGYSNDVNFNPVITVPQSGPHSLTIQSFDAAGNMQQATKYFTVFGAVVTHPTPHASPTPTHSPPPKCLTALVFANFVAHSHDPAGPPSNMVLLTWTASAGCPPLTGSFTRNYNVPGIPITHGTLNPSLGKFTDAAPQVAGVPNCFVSITYMLTVSDHGGHSKTLTSTATYIFIC